MKQIPLPAHPEPHHPPISYTIDADSGRPIPGEGALIRGDYVYVPEDGSRITEDEYIRPWRGPDVFPTADDLISRVWDACYSLHGEGAGMRLMYHWLTGLPGEPGITRRVDRLFSPAVSTIHFSPRPPARAEASATRPLVIPARQPARRAGPPPARAEASAIRPTAIPARQPARRAGAEIPLPAHPEPHHPPIYYTLDPVSGRPIPEVGSVIRSNYVRRPDEYEDTVFMCRIPPWRVSREPIATDFGYITLKRAYYTLELYDGEICVIIHRIPWFPRLCRIRRRPLNGYIFAPRRSPAAAEAARIRAMTDDDGP